MKNMSPGMRRLLEHLQAHPEPISATLLAPRIFVSPRQAQYLLRQLYTAEPPLVHVAAWHQPTGAGAQGRQPIRLWAFGEDIDATRPPRDDYKTVRNRRKARLIEHYGTRMARRILNSDAQHISLDGMIYVKGRPRGRMGGKRIAE